MKKQCEAIFFLLGIIFGILIESIVLAFLVDTAPKEIEPVVRAEIEEIPKQKVSTINIYVEPKLDEKILEEIEEEEEEEIEELHMRPVDHVLTASLGIVQGPTNIEKYYNLPMDKVIEKMRAMGYSEQDYPFYIREDGVKMLGDFVMVAALLDKHPRGTVVQTSLGQGIVCDTGEFTEDIFDIAVNW